MTPTEYKSACEATGRTLQEIADILGVALSTLYRRFDDYGRTGRPTIITGEMERAIRSIPKARKNNCAERSRGGTPQMSNESKKGADRRCLPRLVRLERGDGQAVNPAYSSDGYEEFCQREKDKGLRRDLWDKLPELWERELEFRAKFEAALAKFSEPNDQEEASADENLNRSQKTL